MDGIKDWLFPTSPVEAVIRFRPLSLELFRRMGVDPWRAPDATVADACVRGSRFTPSWKPIFWGPWPRASKRNCTTSFPLEGRTEERRC